MTLLSRASQLLRADLNALLDRLEEPEALLKQAILDMEAALEQSAHQLNAIDEQLAKYTKAQSDLASDIAELEQRLDTCFEHEEVDLARTIVKRRLLLVERQKFYATQFEQLTRDRATLQQAFERQECEVDEFKQRLSLSQGECERPTQSAFDHTTLHCSPSDATIETELLQARAIWQQGRERSS